jgi:hypothetical protein
MKLQIIQLEAHDDVISIRDRLAFVNTERVLLVLPDTAAILKRKLDLVLIQREAARRRARLALVTNDPVIMENAAELNISTFASVTASQRATWKRPLNKVFVDRSDKPVTEADPYELRLIASRLRPLTDQERKFRRIARVVAALMLFWVVAGLVLFVIPSADVVIIPAQRQINKTVRLVGDSTITSVNVETGHIPAGLLVIDVTTQASIPTTSNEDRPSGLSNGVIIFTNQTYEAVAIPLGTIVKAIGTNPPRFRTTQDAVVEAGVGQVVEVQIQATEDWAGPNGNVDANLIINLEGPLADSLSVRNSQATSGGTVRQQGVVTQADWDNLLILARERIKQTALTEFSPRLTGSQFVAPDSIKIIEEHPEWTTYSAYVGDSADNLVLTLRANVQALVIDEQLAKQAALAALAANFPEGWQVLPQSVRYTRGEIQKSDENGQVGFLMSASASVAKAINLDTVRQQIAGTSPTDAINIMNQTLLLDAHHSPEIRIWPGIFGRLPLLPIRINVKVQQ